jgi:hypothetical protein
MQGGGGQKFTGKVQKRSQGRCAPAHHSPQNTAMDEGTYNIHTHLLVHMHQNKKIALEVAAKIASVNWPYFYRI